MSHSPFLATALEAAAAAADVVRRYYQRNLSITIKADKSPVTEADVEVAVGGSVFRVEGWRYEPIVVELRPGDYPLTMSRDGRTVFEQPFQIDGGRDTILTAYDPSRLTDTAGPNPAGRGCRGP